MSDSVGARLHSAARRWYRRSWPKAARQSVVTNRLKRAFVTALGRVFGAQAVYDSEYFREVIDPAAMASAAAMAEAIVRDLRPQRVLDVGCGSGALLAAIRDRGCEVLGLERARAGLAKCRERGVPARAFDLKRDVLAAEESFDLAVSFEVAEHLSADSADRFVKVLAGAADWVVMSAARPGQGGLDHLNEQEPRYWIDKFERYGFETEERLRRCWRAEWETKGVVGWYRENLLVFRRTSGPPGRVGST